MLGWCSVARLQRRAKTATLHPAGAAHKKSAPQPLRRERASSDPESNHDARTTAARADTERIAVLCCTALRALDRDACRVLGSPLKRTCCWVSRAAQQDRAGKLALLRRVPFVGKHRRR